MTSSDSAADGTAAWADEHASGELLASYAGGTVATVAVWSVEAHLGGCARCRSALSVYADPERLARNRSVLLARVALPDGGRMRRLLRRWGIPDYLLDLLAATPSLRLSWLLSVLGVLAVVTGEAAAVSSGWHQSGRPSSDVLVPFLLVAPLLVLAGVAAAFLPVFDPAYQLAVAAPFPGVRLLLVRSISALTAALLPVAAAAFVLPGPWWLPVALLLPSLALCAFALAAATVISPQAAAVTAGALWALPVAALAMTRAPLLIVQSTAQLACGTVLCISAVVLWLRNGRFELGWMK
jgi:hypothetical protein